MSGFYNVENPGNFNTNNPTILLQRNLRFIKKGFNQKDEIENLATGDTTILAKEMLAGWIIRTPLGVDQITDTSDTAVNIYNEIVRVLKGQCSDSFGILPGFNFDFGIYNEGEDAEIIFQPGDGVVFGIDNQFLIPSGKSVWFRLTVTRIPNKTVTPNITPEIYITQLSSPALP